MIQGGIFLNWGGIHMIQGGGGTDGRHHSYWDALAGEVMLLEEAVSLIHRFSFATYVAQHILFSSSFLLLFVFQNRQNILSSLNNPTLPSCEDFSSTLLVYLNCLKKSPREMFALQRHNALCIVLILLCLVFVFVYLCICVFAYLCICVFVYLCIYVFVYFLYICVFVFLWRSSPTPSQVLVAQ